jgi:hypothetical protein
VCCCTPIFPNGVAVRPEELNMLLRPLLTCAVLCAFALTSIETLLPWTSLVWFVAFENLKPADLNDGFQAIRIVRVADEKSALYAL